MTWWRFYDWRQSFPRISKRKWSLKEEKIKQNLSAIAEDFSLKKIVYIQGSPALFEPFFLINHRHKPFWNSNLNEPQRRNFVLIITQLSEVDIQPSSELLELLIQMSSLFIHVNNFKITITNLNSKLCIYYLKSWHFIDNWVSNFLEERSWTICASSPYNLGMKTEIKKFDLVYRFTRLFIKHNPRVRMQGP